MVSQAGTGINRETGFLLCGWPHVEQSIAVIFSTRFGTRVMRRWFGSLVPALLGENISPSTLLRFFTAIHAGLAFEPRFALTRIRVLSEADELRAGKLRLELEGQYRPRAHLGDFTTDRTARMILPFGG